MEDIRRTVQLKNGKKVVVTMLGKTGSKKPNQPIHQPTGPIGLLWQDCNKWSMALTSDVVIGSQDHLDFPVLVFSWQNLSASLRENLKRTRLQYAAEKA